MVIRPSLNNITNHSLHAMALKKTEIEIARHDCLTLEQH